MKAPATLADLGLAALVVFALRDRPRWAALGAVAILLHPAVIDVSAWWGQYESIFVLFASRRRSWPPSTGTTAWPPRSSPCRS